MYITAEGWHVCTPLHCSRGFEWSSIESTLISSELLGFTDLYGQFLTLYT